MIRQPAAATPMPQTSDHKPPTPNQSRDQDMGKSLRNIDSVTRTQLIKSYCWLFPFLSLIGIALYQLKGVLIAAIVSLPLSFAVVFMADRFGIFAGKLYGGRRPDWKDAEFFEADIDRIRHLKVKKDYGNALREVNRVLKQSPNLSEALYLKAQILHEGFDNTEAARLSLDKILARGEGENETIYRWAASLREELAGGSNEKPSS
jgi:hypothetical protein